MKLSKQWLQKQNACSETVVEFTGQKETDLVKVLKIMVRKNKLEWANWLIVRKMSYKQYVSYAVYAAQQVLKNYESEYPDDKRPRQAIEAAIKCIKNPTKANKSAAWSAAESAEWSAAESAAWSAEWSAARSAAESAESAAESAAWSAAESAARSAAWSAAWSAEWSAARSAAESAESAMQKKILKYGIKLLEK